MNNDTNTNTTTTTSADTLRQYVTSLASISDASRYFTMQQADTVARLAEIWPDLLTLTDPEKAEEARPILDEVCDQLTTLEHHFGILGATLRRLEDVIR